MGDPGREHRLLSFLVTFLQCHGALLSQVKASTFDEDLDKGSFKSPADYAIETATHKAIDVARQPLEDNQMLADIVIGSDTVLFCLAPICLPTFMNARQHGLNRCLPDDPRNHGRANEGRSS